MEGRGLCIKINYKPSSLSDMLLIYGLFIFINKLYCKKSGFLIHLEVILSHFRGKKTFIC